MQQLPRSVSETPAGSRLQTSLLHGGLLGEVNQRTHCVGTGHHRPASHCVPVTWCDLYPVSEKETEPGKVTPTSHTLTRGDQG